MLLVTPLIASATLSSVGQWMHIMPGVAPCLFSPYTLVTALYTGLPARRHRLPRQVDLMLADAIAARRYWSWADSVLGVFGRHAASPIRPTRRSRSARSASRVRREASRIDVIGIKDFVTFSAAACGSQPGGCASHTRLP